MSKKFKNPKSKGRGNYHTVQSRGTGALIGKSTSYVYYLQREQPELFQFFCLYADTRTFVDGYNKFHKDMDELVEKARTIHYFLKENRVMTIPEWFDMQNFTKHPNIYRILRGGKFGNSPVTYMNAFTTLTSNVKLNKQVAEWLENIDKED